MNKPKPPVRMAHLQLVDPATGLPNGKTLAVSAAMADKLAAAAKKLKRVASRAPEDIPALVARLRATALGLSAPASGMDGRGWEDAIFINATSFTAVLYRTERRDFTTYDAAMECAKGMKDAQGRPGLIYAITEAGRQFAIGPADRDRYLAIWQEMKKQEE